MGDGTAISWSDATWNPIRSAIGGELGGKPAVRWGCERVSPGCDNCYASTLHERRGGQPYPKEGTVASPPEALFGGTYAGRETLQLHERTLTQPLRWSKSRKVFVCSMTDLFGAWVPGEWIAQVFSVMERCPQRTFQVLTKRAKRMMEWGQHNYPSKPPENIWWGVSVESQEYAWRLNHLLRTPAAVRFVSAEPLLGALDLLPKLTETVPSVAGNPGIHWLIDGGESGPGYRPADPDWFRSLRDQCAAADVAYWHKQGGGPRPGKDELLDGVMCQAFPKGPADGGLA